MKAYLIFLTAVVIISGLVINAQNTEKRAPKVRSCAVEIEDLTYQLNQCKMIRGEK